MGCYVNNARVQENVTVARFQVPSNGVTMDLALLITTRPVALEGLS
jgi:hypothetical protein